LRNVLYAFLIGGGVEGVGGGIFFIFPLFPTCSLQVPYVPKILSLPLAQAKNGDETALE
jgi:hypothetical protein